MQRPAPAVSRKEFEDIVDPETRVLVVDDSQSMRHFVTTNLREFGIRNVMSSEDGRLAWDLLQRETFDIIICDHRMPEITGVELLKLVRSGGALKDIPFIMITGEASRENVMEAMENGVSNFIVKPFSSQQLMDKLAQTLLKERAGKREAG